MLHDTCKIFWSIKYDAVMTSSIFWAQRLMRSLSAVSKIMVNSSPPNRAIKSSVPMHDFKRCATSMRSSSPMVCPKESLMVLNSSKSINNTDNGVCFLMSSLKVSTNKKRLGSPVRVSCVAICSILFWLFLMIINLLMVLTPIKIRNLN